MASCPNKHNPDWKILVAKYGEDGAFQKFIDNGYEIPETKPTSKRSLFDVVGEKFSSRDTLRSLEDNPDMGKEIVDRLKQLYPDTNIYEGGLFDENGQWRELKPGEKGMHYRNAFQGAVAWANDSYLETPPHEYAHEYIDMFRNHPMVKEAIEKYGEEQLVTRMGRLFAKKQMSSKFTNFANNFWNMVRSLFGSPDIGYILADNFYKGKKLEGPIHRGTGIYRFQTPTKPYERIKGAWTPSAKYDSAKDPAQSITEQDVLTKLMKDFEGDIYDVANKEFNLHRLTTYLYNQQDKLKKIDTNKNGDYNNTAGLDTRLLDDAKTVFANTESLRKIAKFIVGEKLTDDKSLIAMGLGGLNTEEKMAYDMIIKVQQKIDYVYKVNKSFLDGNGNMVPMLDLVAEIEKEIENTANRKENIYKKIKNKWLKKVLKKGEVLLRWQLNGRLAVKYLSGGENTEMSNIFYKSLDHAESTRLDVMQKFYEELTEKELNKNYKKWSFFNQQKSNIDQLETQEFTLESKNGSGPVKLTKNEMLTMYLNLRQYDSGKAIRDNGFMLDDNIPGRDIKPNTVFEFGFGKTEDGKSMSTAQKIIEAVEGDADMMKIVTKVDAALDYMYEQTNGVFEQINGYTLPKIESYFPVYMGTKTLAQRRMKTNINDLRSGHARLGQKEPLRIGDVMGVMNNVKNSGALYTAFTIPIDNNRKLLSQIKEKHIGTQEEHYFDMMEGLLNRLEDNSNLFSNQGEEGVNKLINMLTSNFAVSVLAMNVAVMLKQPISYLTAMEEIDKRYLKAVGWGVGGIVGIKPTDIFKSLSYTGVEGGETLLPVEWRMDTTNEVYQEMIKHSPKMRARLQGMISKEAGEALMNAEIGQDKVKMPWKNKDGSPAYISKARLMEGIKMFDSATIMSIWKAVKLETAEVLPGLDSNAKEGTAEYEAYWNHVEGRVNEIVNKTQPTYDQTNRSEGSSISNPMARVLTMFSSARSKVAMLMLDGIISYLNNPTKENQQKLMKRSLNIMVTTSLALTMVDMLKGAVLYGMDDDDIAELVITSTVLNNLGYIYGVGTLGQLVVSQLDSKPWHKTVQHPVEMLMQEFSQAFAHLVKGNVGDGTLKAIEGIFKTTGLPLYAEIVPKQIYKGFNE